MESNAMVCRRPLAEEYKITVPSKSKAEDVALALANRGHRLIAAREAGQLGRGSETRGVKESQRVSKPKRLWDVFSLVNGPEPDKDHEWWVAMEEKALRNLARHHGGDQFNKDGLLYRLDAVTASTRRLETLGSCPARASERVAMKLDVDEDLPDSPGQPIRLEGVDDVNWAALEHAYGEATDVPDMLRTLASNNDCWDEANSQLSGSVTHQESIYSATAPAMRFLAKIASDPQLSGKRRLDLLYTLFMAGCQQDLADFWGYELRSGGPVGLEVRDAVVSQVAQLLPLWPSVSRAEQRLLLLLAALVPEGAAVEPVDFSNPASRLAQALLRAVEDAEAVLFELARTYEELIPITEGDGPRRSRIITAIHGVLFD
ncbi:uncharacterized protein E0L32_002211 [Thyridium curvatum]|uniref:Uncharacterized protein n=1 Tax=Thyridium curvatum TaxID=1093900 RepID=A0A507ACX9_9PEZI|nr:uncharacterized protein E0L32_002211 [Thyridium curvatum]TPX06715.1 hypothetical protein E0L32_002211 [Thyridium curvatum]